MEKWDHSSVFQSYTEEVQPGLAGAVLGSMSSLGKVGEVCRSTHGAEIGIYKGSGGGPGVESRDYE